VRSSVAAKGRAFCAALLRPSRSYVLTAFAKLAADRGYIRPEFNSTGELLIIGRAPSGD